MTPLTRLALGALLTAAVGAHAAQPAPAAAGQDDGHLPGADSSALFWQGREQIAGFRNIDRLAPVRWIAAGDRALELPAAGDAIGTVSFEFAGDTLTLDDYLDRQRVAGLLVLKDGSVAYERYRLGNDAQTRWISFSVAKSVVAMLIGAAIADGYIDSVDERVTAYLPRLAGSAYDQATIRDLLQMASGVAWNEDYADPESDVARATYDTLSLYDYLRDKPRNAPPGERFNYNTAETNLAGTLLRAAIGNNLSTYLSEKIWQPFGMESDAYWQLTEPGGGEFGGCCISATLRDYARLGLFALGDGRLADGSRVLPEGWMAESTRPSPGYDGYGYFWWLHGNGAYEAMGIFGQSIYVDPANGVVIAQHSARAEADREADWAMQAAAYAALVEAVSGG
ncbi:MAG: serine hydrolase [Gammaproteobacteria bacterium]|nr:serine hydrolase [Gammaproteobacteria bacterium]MBK80076.1 serine hydrolase [Gammaproteobacteria bacterium]